MKNLFQLCLGCILIAGLLAGCANDNAAPKEDVGQQTEATATVKSEEQTETTTKEPEEQASQEAEVEQKETPATEESTAKENSEAPADITNAVNYAEATDPTKAVPMGTYMKLSKYSTEDRMQHMVYVKLNKVTSESDDAEYVKKAIEENNAEGSEYDTVDKAAMELPSDVELNVIDYEVVIPEDFPASEFGISGIHVDFTAVNIDGGGIPSNDSNSVYLNLGSGDDLLMTGDEEKTFMPGQTYQLRGYFLMVKGFDQYVFRVSSYPEGSDGSSGYEEAYFANK